MAENALPPSSLRLAVDNGSVTRVPCYLDARDAAIMPMWYALPESFRAWIRMTVQLAWKNR